MLSYFSFIQVLTTFSCLSLVRQAAAIADAWHLDYTSTLAIQQLDPIVNPNSQSGHMHQIIGGSRFGASYDHDNLLSSKCSTVRVQADKSNYWVPQLYWYENNLPKPFIPVRASFRFYYFLVGNSDNEPVAPFPKGLRMLVGAPENKSPSNYVSYACQTNPQLQNAIPSDNFNYPRDCPNGLKTIILFPSCWNGKDLYKSDGSHMAYPGPSVRISACPITHPVKVPHIQLEVGWFPSEIAPGQPLDGHLVWANGDSTGYGLHGDFANGWDMDLLTRALNTTGCVGMKDEIPMEQCPVFAPSSNAAAQTSCSPELGQLQEPEGNSIGIPISALPGCNPVWGYGPKPTCSTPPPALDVSKFLGVDGPYVVPAASRRDYQMPTTPGWTKIACLYNRESLVNFTEQRDNGLTVERCIDSCARTGYTYAGMGMRSSPACICGSGITPGTGVATGMCTTPCPGNSTQTCGNTNVFDIYYAPNGTQTAVTAPTNFYMGCLTNPGNGLIAASSSTFWSYGMTTEMCAQGCAERNSTYFFTYRGNQCFCGTNYDIGTGVYQPDDMCTYGCAGNSSQICGDSYRASIYSLKNSPYTFAAKVPLPGFQGCYAKPSSGLALSNTSWTTSDMTVSACLDGCKVLNYRYASLDNGRTCSCGDVPNVGALYPTNQCASQCAGDSTQTCGSFMTVEIYNTSASALDPVAVAAARPSGWLGCYANSGATTALSDYSYRSGSMTSSICKTACAGFNYPFAGLDSSNRCSCGATAPKSSLVAPSNCNAACAGNSTEFCGANSYMDVFNSKQPAGNTTAVSAGSGEGYKGCFQDLGSKGLTGYYFKSLSLTVEMCTSGCKELGFSLAALHSASACYCGNSWQGQLQLPESSCDFKCAGNSTQTCGSNGISSLYDTAKAPASASRIESWLGCYTDSTSKRTLSGYSYVATDMTINVCRAACSLKGYALAGVENGRECYCDNAMVDAARTSTGLCGSPCSGNATQSCGGAGTLDVYNTTGAVPRSNGNPGYVGCFADYGSINTWAYSSDALTTPQCQQMCTLKQFKYAATRYAKICQCGNTLPQTLLSTASCNMPCAGDNTTTCGTATAVSVYDVTSPEVAQSGTSAAIDPTPDAKGSVGCFQRGSGFVLDNLVLTSATLTNNLCTSSCGYLGYTFSATQGGKNCYCGNSLNSTTASYRVLPSNCNSACTGASTETCGSGDKLQVYNVATTGIPPASTTVEGYKGCFNMGDVNTVSPYVYNYFMMTATLCRRICRNKGFSGAALNNGRNCACSNDLKMGAKQPFTWCSTPCPGNNTEICGQSTTVSIYDTTGPGAYPPTSGVPVNFVGCFNDMTSTPATNPLNGFSVASTFMTTAMCHNTCVGKGFSTYGTQGKQCYCGNGLPVTMVADSICSWNCNGNAAERCGGGGVLSVYSASSVAYTPPVANASSTSTASNSTASSTASISDSTATASPNMTSTAFSSNATSTALSSNSTSISFTITSNVTSSALATSVPTASSGNVRQGSTSSSAALTSAATPNSSASSSAGSSSSSVAVAPSVSSSSSSVLPSSTVSSSNAISSSSASSSSVASSSGPSSAAASSSSSASSSFFSSSASSSSSTPSITITSTASTSSSASSSVLPSSSSSSSFSSAVFIGAPSSSSSVSASAASSSSSSELSSAYSSSSSWSSADSSTLPASSSSVAASSSATGSASDLAASSSSVVADSTSTTSSASSTSSAAAVSSSPATASSTSSWTADASSSSSSSEATSSSVTSNSDTSSSVQTSSASSLPATSSTSSVFTPSESASSSSVFIPSESAASSNITSSTSTASSASSAAASSSSTGVPSRPINAETSYYGCFSQPYNIVSSVNMTCSSLTPNMCKVWCKTNNFEYSGVSNGGYCGCTNSIAQLSPVPESRCSAPCAGQASTMCGGTDVFSIYQSNPEGVNMKRASPRLAFRRSYRSEW